MNEKYELLKNAKKLGLVLSGGAAKGAYEIGVYKALRELGLEPSLYVGTSIGAMNSYILAQGGAEEAENLWLTLKTGDVFDYTHIIANKGVTFQSVAELLSHIFSEDAVRKAPVDFGIATVRLSDMSTIHKWKEDMQPGTMLDWVLASCSIIPVVKPYDIGGEKYIDGGFGDHMPVSMALEKECDGIVAVNTEALGIVDKEALAAASDRMVYITPSQSLKNSLNFNSDHARRMMRMGYLDMMKALGKYEGILFCFEPKSFSESELKAAEAAGEIFDLPFDEVYTKETFMQSLSEAVAVCRAGGVKDAQKVIRQKGFLLLCDNVKKDGGAALWMITSGLV